MFGLWFGVEPSNSADNYPWHEAFCGIANCLDQFFVVCVSAIVDLDATRDSWHF
jgi:hypothetical protein